MNRAHYMHAYYRWISAYPSISYETAKRAARAYLPAGFPYLPKDQERAENVLFWPLVQWGVVRYLGSRQYACSPPLAYRLLEEKYLLINTREEGFRQRPDANQHGIPGLKISDTPPNNPEVQILPSYSLADFLPLIPPLRKIIKAWSPWPNPIQDFTQVRYRGHWRATTRDNVKDHIQLFRMTEGFGGSQAVRIDDMLYRIPGRTENPDAYPLAVLYADLNTKVNDLPPINIDPVAHTLTINSFLFPSELRKLLFLEHVVIRSSFPALGGPYSFRPDALVFLQKRLTPQP